MAGGGMPAATQEVGCRGWEIKSDCKRLTGLQEYGSLVTRYGSQVTREETLQELKNGALSFPLSPRAANVGEREMDQIR